MLLFFSCNKTPKKVKSNKPNVIRNERPTAAPTQLPSHQLAATGS